MPALPTAQTTTSPSCTARSTTSHNGLLRCPEDDAATPHEQCHRVLVTFSCMNTLEIDQLLARFAIRQFGLVTSAQAAQFSITRSVLQARVQARTLEWLHSGVYRVCAVAPCRKQRLLAACLAIPESVVSDLSAALVHGLPIGRSFDHLTPSVLISHDRAYRSGAGVTVRNLVSERSFAGFSNESARSWRVG